MHEGEAKIALQRYDGCRDGENKEPVKDEAVKYAHISVAGCAALREHVPKHIPNTFRGAIQALNGEPTTPKAHAPVKLHRAGDLRQAIGEYFRLFLCRVAADEFAFRLFLWNGELNNLVISVAVTHRRGVDA